MVLGCTYENCISIMLLMGITRNKYLGMMWSTKKKATGNHQLEICQMLMINFNSVIIAILRGQIFKAVSKEKIEQEMSNTICPIFGNTNFCLLQWFSPSCPSFLCGYFQIHTLKFINRGKLTLIGIYLSLKYCQVSFPLKPFKLNPIHGFCF